MAHAPGVSASQAGAGGSLAEVILRASAWIENYCQQGTTADHSLFALSRTEKWGMPGRRALLDVDGTLVMRPGHFPVQSVASLAVQLPSGASAEPGPLAGADHRRGAADRGAAGVYGRGAVRGDTDGAHARGAAVGERDVYGRVRRRGGPV